MRLESWVTVTQAHVVSPIRDLHNGILQVFASLLQVFLIVQIEIQIEIEHAGPGSLDLTQCIGQNDMETDVLCVGKAVFPQVAPPLFAVHI